MGYSIFFPNKKIFFELDLSCKKNQIIKYEKNKTNKQLEKLIFFINHKTIGERGLMLTPLTSTCFTNA